MARGSVLHVAGLGRSAAIQAGAVTPFGIQLDAVRWVGDHQRRLTLAQQAADVFLPQRVAAEHPVFFTEPQVARPGSGDRGKGRRLVRLLLVGDGQQLVDLLGVEAG